MKWIKRLILLIILATIGYGIYGAVALTPDYEMNAAVTINADPDDIHEYVNNFKKWGDWIAIIGEANTGYTSTVGDTYEGEGAWMLAEGGVNLKYSITKSDEDKGIEFATALDGESAKSSGSISYEQVDGGTRVTWVDKGSFHAWYERYYQPFYRMALQGIMKQGLDSLKKKVESDNK